MNSIEKRLKYYELIMKYDDTSKFINYELPEGFEFVFYKVGDEDDWVKIHISTGEFCSYQKGLEYFHQFFDSFSDQLYKRCFFIVDENTNEKIATATVSLLKNKEFEYEAAVDWIAIRKEYQGRCLSKPLISKIVSLANELGNDKMILHTQTHTWLAAKLYLDFGFEPLHIEENYEGWQILKTLTNHNKLSNLESIEEKEMYSELFCKIFDKLREIYGEDFNYSIWNTNNRNDVYVYHNNEEYNYKFYIKDDDILLEEYDKEKLIYDIIPYIDNEKNNNEFL